MAALAISIDTDNVVPDFVVRPTMTLAPVPSHPLEGPKPLRPPEKPGTHDRQAQAGL
jgi:hypothetical protein